MINLFDRVAPQPSAPRPARNAQCRCGSGKKYKRCCGQEQGERADVTPVEIAQLDVLLRARRYVELERAARALVMRVPEAGVAWKALSLSLALQGKQALDAFTRAAQLLANDAEVHSNLGLAQQRAGRAAAASSSCRRALAINPHYVAAHVNLGHALADLGQLDDAVASYRRAIELKADHAEACLHLGNVLLRLGRLAEAADSYQRACEIPPANALSHYNLGVVLRELGRLDEAAASYRRAIAIKSDSAAAHANLALVLRQLGEGEEAARCCRKTLELDPNNAVALMALAELDADRGDFVQAESLLKRAISLDPASAVAWAGLVRIRKMSPGDSGWLAEALSIAKSPLPPREEAYLRYAIGKYFDDVEDYDQAFAEVRRANELARSYTPTHSREELTAYIDTVIGLFDAAWRDLVTPYAHPSPRPVFIVGTPRSGTTLAEQIMASHPEVFGAGELTYWKTASTTYLASAAGGADCAPLIGQLTGDYLRMLRELSPDARRVVDKMPANFLFLGLIHCALPNARIIHMQRHPIDTCLSIYFQNFETTHFYANDLDDLAHYYRQYQRLMMHWRAVLPDAAILDVPYEALVKDPDAWSRRMIDFIGLPWDPRCRDSHLTDRPVLTSSRWQVRQKINDSAVGRWRHYEKHLESLKTLIE